MQPRTQQSLQFLWTQATEVAEAVGTREAHNILVAELATAMEIMTAESLATDIEYLAKLQPSPGPLHGTLQWNHPRGYTIITRTGDSISVDNYFETNTEEKATDIKKLLQFASKTLHELASHTNRQFPNLQHTIDDTIKCTSYFTATREATQNHDSTTDTHKPTYVHAPPRTIQGLAAATGSIYGVDVCSHAHDTRPTVQHFLFLHQKDALALLQPIEFEELRTTFLQAAPLNHLEFTRANASGTIPLRMAGAQAVHKLEAL